MPFFQAKLTINEPGDRYEQEADAVADRVVDGPKHENTSEQTVDNNNFVDRKAKTDSAWSKTIDTAPIQQKNTTPSISTGPKALKAIQPNSWTTSKGEGIQRQEELPEDRTTSLPILPTKISSADGEPVQMQSWGATSAPSSLPSKLNRTKGSGTPLSPVLSTEMSSGFGADFSEVRIHTGSQAVQMNQELHARAFTYGADVYFNRGEYDPSSKEGKRLLAHELTHVVQQGAATPNDIQAKHQRISEQSSAGDPVIQRDRQNDTIVPVGDVEIRKGRIVFSYDWYMSHATKNKQSGVNVYSPEAWMVIVKKLRTINALGWLTDREIKEAAPDLYIIGSLNQWQGGNIELHGYTVINLIAEAFGLPKGEAFRYYHIGKEMLLLVDSTKIDYDDEPKMRVLAKEMADELLAITGLKLLEETQALESDILSLIMNSDTKNESILKLMLDEQLFHLNFGKQQWEDYRKKLKLGLTSVKRKAPPAPTWLIILKERVNELIVTERYNDPKAEDLPDRFYTWWDNTKWRGVGEQKAPGRKKKLRAGIDINADMEAAQVLARIREGLRKRMLKQGLSEAHREALTRQSVPKSYKWAEDIRLALMRRVNKDTKGWRDHRKLNTPDNLQLHIADDKVYLVVMVIGRLEFDKKDEPVIPKKSAVFPADLQPAMLIAIDPLYEAVNKFAYQLRVGTKKKVDDSAVEAALANRMDESFPAYIKAHDMREDYRTVNNGHHRFFMALNYFDRGYYEGIESVAEASRNTITEWRVFSLDAPEVRQAFSLPEPEATVDENEKYQSGLSAASDEKWLMTRGQYQRVIDNLMRGINNTPDKSSIKKFTKLPKYQFYQDLGNGFAINKSYDSKKRDQDYTMTIPADEGDYILFAHTYFEYSKKRYTLPSVAAFVFRALDAKKLARKEAHSRPNRIAAIERKLTDPSINAKDVKKLQQELNQLRQLEEPKYSLYDNFQDKKSQIIIALRLYRILLRYVRATGGNKVKVLEKIRRHSSQKHPRDKDVLPELWAHFMEDYGYSAYSGVVNGLKHKISQLENQEDSVDKFNKRINSYKNYFADRKEVETPEVVFISEVTGKAYRLLMMVGEASDSFLDDNPIYQMAKNRGQLVYVLTDVTTKDTDRFVGMGFSKAAAIKHAFEQFGEDNSYGDGYLHYRIPGGPEGGVRNSPGLERQVRDALNTIAAVAGIIALAFATVATGGIVGGIALVAGITAGVAGGITAYHNISERIENNRFSFDVEFALDLVAIIGAFAAGAGAITKLSTVSRLGSTAAALSRVSNFLKLPTVLALHSIADLGANAILMAIKVQKDLDALDKAKLSDSKRAALKRQILSNAITSGAMLMMSTKGVGDDVEAITAYIKERSPIVDRAMPDYDSLNHKTGITDQDGEFAIALRDEAGEPISRKKIQAEEFAVSEGEMASPEAPKAPESKNSGEDVKAESEAKKIKPEDHVIPTIELPDATVMQPKNSKDVDAAEQMYEQLITDSKNREAGIYVNTASGEYMVVQGDQGTVFVVGTDGTKQGLGPDGYAQPWKQDLNQHSSNSEAEKGQWKLMAHYHPVDPTTGIVSDVNRLPSGATGDFGVLVFESNHAGGTSRISRIDYQTKSGRESTMFSYNPKAEEPFSLTYPDPKTGEHKQKKFKTLEDYHQWMKDEFGISLGEVPDHLAAGNKATETADPNAETLTDIPVSSSANPNAAPAPKVPKSVTQRATRLSRKLKRAKVADADVQRLLMRGMQNPDPDAFFKVLQGLLKKNNVVHREVLRGMYSPDASEFAGAYLLAGRLAKGGTYGKRVRSLLKTFDLKQIGRGTEYIQEKHPALKDGWVFRRMEKAAQAHIDGVEILIWDDLPAVGRGEVEDGHQVVEGGKGEAFIEQGIKGDIGEYELTLEALRLKFKDLPERELRRRVDQLFKHQFSNQRRPKAERRALAQYSRDGDLAQLLRSLPASGAIEVEITLASGRVRRVDYLRSENGRPVFRENKNVKSLKAEPDSHIRAEVDKDIALLLRYPDSIVEWRMTDTDRSQAGLGDIADQSFLDYVRDTTQAAGVADRFILIGDDTSTTALRIPANKPPIKNIPTSN